MQSIWAFLALNLVFCYGGVLRDDMARASIEMTELGYEDLCHDTAEAEWFFINKPSNETLLSWEEQLLANAEYKKSQREEVLKKLKGDISDPSLKYKYETIEKAGDELLNNEDFETFVRFVGAVQLLKATPISTKDSKNHTFKDLEHTLSHGNKVETKKSLWTEWHKRFTPFVESVPNHFELLKNASTINGADSVAQYWELLADFENGFDKIKYQWNRISELHRKVRNFAINNFSQKYNMTLSKNIPAYLLGSLQGYDWTAVAADITTTPRLIYDIRKNLWKKKLIGIDMYKTASIMGSMLVNQVPQAEFWADSAFNQQCPAKLINLCRDGIMRVSTCYEPTLSNFLDAHKNVGKILYSQLSVEATPILNYANRYSGLEEGVSELFGILAASPAWMNHTQVTDNVTDNEQRQILSLTITALNVLPRLAYYLAADMWRINAIEAEIKNATELVSSWWNYRQEYEGVTSNQNDLPTFLNDDYIIMNKPYLPKFVGTLLAFQLYNSLMDSTEVRYDRLLTGHIKPNFIKMIQAGAADSWMGMLDKYLEIDDISSSSLLSFFTPLEDFIDELDEEFQYNHPNTVEKELEAIERKIVQEINTPVTTTIPTTTVSAQTTRKRMMNSTVAPKSDGNPKVKDASLKDLESKSSVQVQNDKPTDDNTLKGETATKVPLNESLINTLESKEKKETSDNEEETEEDSTPKINTSKAVWAVGSVLVATIVICIIAIFGRRRCRKTPKNRRYV